MSSSQKIGVILAQVGTPEAPTKTALKPYLREFLSDERIIDSPRWWWLPLLYGVILRRRPAKVAHHFAEIWTKKGLPLLLTSQAQVRGMQKRLGKNYVVKLGLAYAQPSMKTTKLIAGAMKWKKSEYMMTYRSRFGRAEWLQPYTQVELPRLHRQGIRCPVIIAPGFTTDCLETIHELGIEGAELFEEGGGRPENLMRIECLNDEPEWLDYLAKKVKVQSSGW